MPRHIDTPPPERLFLPGPAGDLAATLEMPAHLPRGAVLHLHPLTVEGGTRMNNVVRHGALGSLEAGCAALRVDFRGAGQSAGIYDEGRGEVDDGEAALNWLAQRVPGVPLFLWGFSFGSRVGLDLGIRVGSRVSGYMGVAWPTAFYSWPKDENWPQPMAFLAGDEDELVDLVRMDTATQKGASLRVVPRAGHFFPGKLDEVREFTAGCLQAWLEPVS